MTLKTYSIETLMAAFPPLSPSLKAKSVGGGAAGSNNIVAFQPRNLRELVHSPEGKDRSADALRFAGEAARQGWSREQIRTELLDRSKPISAHCLDQPDPDRAADRAIERAFADLPESKPVTIAPSPYVWVPAEEIPPLDWLLGHWLLRDEISIVVAPGGAGKSTFLAAAALSLATGKSLLGKPVPNGPKRVWIWNLEDSIAMMTRSIQAAARLHGIKPGDLGDRLFLNSARDGSPLCTATRTREGLVVQTPVHEALVAALREKNIDVLVVDPFVSSHEANENDNGEIDKVAKQWCLVAQEANCSVILCHHTSKAGSVEVNTMSARGAVALTAAARVVLVLNPMNATEAKRLGIDPDESWRLLQVTMDKSNRAPLEQADWFRKTSVALGLGDGAGAVEPWLPPKAIDLLTPDVIPVIKKAFGDQDRRESAQSPDWAGYVIAEALELDCPESNTPVRGKVTRIIAELVKQGHLVQVEGKDAKSKTVPCLRVAHPISPPAQSGVETGGEVEHC